MNAISNTQTFEFECRKLIDEKHSFSVAKIMSMHHTSIDDDFIDMSWHNDNRLWKQRFWIFNDRQTKSQNWLWWWNRFCDKTWFATSKINDIQKNETSIDRTDEIVWSYSNDQVFQNFLESAPKSDEIKRIYCCVQISLEFLAPKCEKSPLSLVCSRLLFTIFTEQNLNNIIDIVYEDFKFHV